MGGTFLTNQCEKPFSTPILILLLLSILLMHIPDSQNIHQTPEILNREIDNRQGERLKAHLSVRNFPLAVNSISLSSRSTIPPCRCLRRGVNPFTAPSPGSPLLSSLRSRSLNPSFSLNFCYCG